MSKVVCDNCNKEFKIKLKTQKVKDDVERVYFTCPKCKTEYECYYTNDKVKSLQRRLRGLNNEYDKDRGKNYRNNYETLRQMTIAKNKIGKEMDILKSIYGQLDT